MPEFSEFLKPGQRIDLELLQVEMSRKEEKRKAAVARLGLIRLLEMVRQRNKITLGVRGQRLKRGEYSERMAAQKRANEKQC